MHERRGLQTRTAAVEEESFPRLQWTGVAHTNKIATNTSILMPIIRAEMMYVGGVLKKEKFTVEPILERFCLNLEKEDLTVPSQMFLT